MTTLREFQDRGYRFSIGRSTGGRVLAPHDGLPRYARAFRNARYGRKLYVTIGLRQPKIADGCDGISPSSIGHDDLLCSARWIQPALAGRAFPAPLNAAVASTPALPGPASLRSSTPQPHPESRSPEPGARLLSSQGAHGIPSRLPLPPSSFSPFRLLAAEPRSRNVLLRVRGLRSGCGRTAVLGHASRLPARLAPGARPSAGDLNSWCRCGGVCSWAELNRSESLQQIARWQSLANSGRILPNPYGSRFSVATCGGRTLPRNWNSRSRGTVSNAATAHAEPGHRAIVRRPSPSCWCCSPITSSAAARSNTSCADPMPRTGKPSKPRGSMPRSFEEPSTKSQAEFESRSERASAGLALENEGALSPGLAQGVKPRVSRLATRRSVRLSVIGDRSHRNGENVVTAGETAPQFRVRRGVCETLFRCGEVRACSDARLGRAETNAGGAASAGLIAAGRISNGSPGAPLARCDLFQGRGYQCP